MIILIDSNLYSKEEFGLSFDFMLDHGLIQVKQYLLSYKVVFVGEVITPFNYFVSIPKNFSEKSLRNVELIKHLLKELKNVKRNGKLLIRNKSYQIGNDIESDFYYWQKLYSYFTDYITYEFYFPSKRTIIHSQKKQHGRLNPMLTEANRDRIGSGVTYEVKDHRDNYIRNVFYSVLKMLEDQFASEIESKKIRELEKFLINRNIEFKEIEVQGDVFLKEVKKLQINPTHEVIIKTLISFFLRLKIKEKNTINVFYSQEFEYLCEYLLQKILIHNKTIKNPNWINPDFKTLHPDIITEFFIGDVKYYKISDLDRNSFEKELYAYNIANSNSQQNFILLPSDETKYLKRLTHKAYSIQLVAIDLRDVMNDYHNEKHKILEYVKSLI